MLNTRNIRLVAATILLIIVMSYLAFSSGITSPALRAHPPAQADLGPLPNSLQGGNDAAYKAQGNADAAPKLPSVDNDKTNADKVPVKDQGAEKAPSADRLVDKIPSADDLQHQGLDKVKSTQKDASKEDKEKPKDKAKAPKPITSNSPPSTCNQEDYVVMIDAGSTGSRVHVYRFNTCVSPPQLLSEKFEMLKPGLSSFDTDTVNAAKSLDPLMEVALKAVPKDKQSCTPVAVKATAGLRLLGDEKSTAILKEVRLHLEKDFPFAVVDGDGVSIMDGKDEGVYAWVTANYLLGNIGNKEKLPTAAVFDLGGGSTQIVFEPDFADGEQMVDGEHKYVFTFGDHKFTLYQFSHLGYGLMQGRNKVHQVIVANALKNEKSLTKYASKAATKNVEADTTLVHPCFPPGAGANNVVVEHGKDEFYVVNFKGSLEPQGAQCRHLAEKVLNMEADCTSKSCSFNGVYQPLLVRAFHKNLDMFVFSYFYDKTNPLGFPSSFTVEELRDLTKTVCSGETFWQDVLLGDSVESLKKEPEWCLDLSFITAMLHTGYNIPLSRELKTAKTIANNELGWCLGASLPLLSKGSGWQCRVAEVA